MGNFEREIAREAVGLLEEVAMAAETLGLMNRELQLQLAALEDVFLDYQKSLAMEVTA